MITDKQVTSFVCNHCFGSNWTISARRIFHPLEHQLASPNRAFTDIPFQHVVLSAQRDKLIADTQFLHQLC
jgi:hypothetical protein